MPSIGLPELILVAVIVLIFFGPGRLPELGKLVVVRKAIELALISPAIREEQKKSYSRALLHCERAQRKFRRDLIAMRVGLARWAPRGGVGQAA